MNTNIELRRWLAYGTGVGIEIGPADLTVVVARVRPSGVSVRTAAVIERFRERPAAEWGGEYAALLRKHNSAHLPATAVLPRRDVILRVLNLAGVADRDLESAVTLQIDSLHPFGDDEASWAWSRLGPGSVLVAISRRTVVDDCLRLFSEAGVRLAALTVSAAVLNPAVRMLAAPPAGGFVAFTESGGSLEAYGESAARPVFSAAFDVPPGRAWGLAAAELRLADSAEPVAISALLPKPKAAPAEFAVEAAPFPYAAAIAGACPLLAKPVNLLPAAMRSSSSRIRYVPTAVLGAALAGSVIALAAVKPVEDRKYMEALTREIVRLEPEARKADVLDRSVAAARARTQAIDDFRKRSQKDIDALQELTKMLQPPAFVDQLEMTRNSITLGGQAPQSAGLLKQLDDSPRFKGSEFTIPIVRANAGDIFRLRAAREGAE